MTTHMKLATRGSPLALWQAETVRSLLAKENPDLTLELVICKTTGDRNLQDPLSQIGTVGLFTAEVNKAVLDGRADLAVHSLKDCPFQMEEGIVLAGTLERSSPLDAFLPREEGMTFDNLAPGSTIATGSLRRRAQILAARPDLRITELRGNIDTRLEKRFEPGTDAIVMAEAALLRLGIDPPRALFDSFTMIPAVAQGIVGIAAREGDDRAAGFVASISHLETFTVARAERGLLGVLEGGCRVPIGAFAELDNGKLHLRAIVASLDGDRCIREEIEGEAADAEDLGVALGKRMLQQGAAAILDQIRLAEEP